MCEAQKNAEEARRKQEQNKGTKAAVQPQVPRMLVTWAVHRPIVVEYHT